MGNRKRERERDKYAASLLTSNQPRSRFYRERMGWNFSSVHVYYKFMKKVWFRWMETRNKT